MKRITFLLLLTTGFISAAPLTDEQILEAVRSRETKLEEITAKPQLLQGVTKFLCNEPKPEQIAEEKANPHLEKYARFFVDKAGRPAAEGHEPAHPQGTVLLKEKLPATVGKDDKVAPGKTPELFTGMLKREKGFNKECGDWEFFTVSGDSKKVTARGKLTSCMDCHQRYPDFDYTSRKLVPLRVSEPGADGSLVLPAGNATVSGTDLRCDMTSGMLTNWKGDTDAASWPVKIASGRYAVEMVHACGAGNAGAEVEIQFFHQGVKASPFFTLEMKLEGTGEPGTFKSRTAGFITLKNNGQVTLKAVTKKKPGAAVMDLRQIVLRPVVESSARRAPAAPNAPK